MEAMAIESMVASLWELEGYLVKTRLPVEVAGGYSDLDIVGCAQDVVRVAECKARGPAQKVNVISGGFMSWLEKREWASFIGNVELLWAQPPPWLIAKSATKLEVWFCGNIWFESHAAQELANVGLADAVRKVNPEFHSVSARVFSTRDVFLRVVERVRARIVDDEHGKRFGSPLLDAVRELVRYADPRVTGARGAVDTIRRETRDNLLTALGLSPPDLN